MVKTKKKAVETKAGKHAKTARAIVAAKGAKARAAKPAPVAALSKIKIPAKFRPVYDALGRLRERVVRQINFLATDNLNRTPNDAELDFRSEEQGTDNFDRDFALNRVSLDQDIIFEIDEALNRIQLGTYGVCESCNHAIEKARMAALPYSRMCIKCQSKSEVGRKHLRSFEAGALFPNLDKVAAEVPGEDE